MDIVAQAAKSFGDNPALITPGKSWSFAELDAECARIASAFASECIVQGDIVAIVAPNSPAMLLTLMALLRIGAVAAPVNQRFPAGHIDGVLQRLAPKMILADPAEGIATSTMAVGLRQFVAHAVARDSTSFTAASDFERPVSVIHTSASSGAPKAALLSFSNHWHNALGSAENLPFGPGDCWLLSLPLYHIGGYSMIFKCLAGGGAIAAGGPELTIEGAIEALPVTHLSLVPTQLYRMLRTTRGTAMLKGVKAILLGGSAAGIPLLDAAVTSGIPVYLTYGSTEMGSQVSTSTGPIGSPVTDSGNILPFREAAISSEGEILVKGPCLFLGYLETNGLKRSRDSEGWFHTGDVGSISDDGRLTVLGRRDNMFISGGENIHPEEIEKALAAIPGIEEALVVPVPDNEYGMRPKAWIRVADGTAVDDRTIAARIGVELGRLKTPVAFSRVSEWVTIAGSAKIDRNWYRKQAKIQ
jgi:o-succinylbenzoate---CoA ligase